MLSLRRTVRGRFESDSGFGAGSVAEQSRHFRVLPRPLRYVLRYFTRYVETARPKPLGAGSAFVAGFFVLTGAYAAYLNGEAAHVVATTTSTLGLQVDEIEISGIKETAEQTIVHSVGLTSGNAIMGFSVAQARERLLDLPWVKSAEVRKVYPGKLTVKVSERSPFAVWQHQGAQFVVERDGDVIEPKKDMRFAQLPLVVGAGANEAAGVFLREASDYPQVYNQAEAFIFVAERRWDVRLKNGVTIRLPERGYRKALEEVSDLDAETGLFERDIRTVDYRLPDRVVLRLSEEAAEKRRAVAEKRLKEHLKAEKERAT